MPSVVSVLINLVLHGNLGQVSNDVLDLGVCLGALLAAKVVQPAELVHEVVGDGADDGDTNGVTPDNADGNDGSTSIGGEEGVAGDWVGLLKSSKGLAQPTEDTEEGSKDIDTENGTNQLPRWPGLSTTSDEDEPVLSEGDLEEEHTLDGTKVVDHTTVWKEERSTENPGTKGEFDTENDRDDPDFWQLPLDWSLFEMSVVVSDGNGGQISKEGKEHNQLGDDGLADDDHGGDEVDFHVQAESDTVLDVCLHSLENLTSDLDGRDNGGKTWGKEDNIGGGLSGFGGTLDGDTTVRLLQ